MAKVHLTMDLMKGHIGFYDCSNKKAEKLMKKLIEKTMEKLNLKKKTATAAIASVVMVSGSGYNDYIESLETETLDKFEGVQVRITFYDFQCFKEYIKLIQLAG